MKTFPFPQIYITSFSFLSHSRFLPRELRHLFRRCLGNSFLPWITSICMMEKKLYIVSRSFSFELNFKCTYDCATSHSWCYCCFMLEWETFLSALVYLFCWKIHYEPGEKCWVWKLRGNCVAGNLRTVMLSWIFIR